VAAEKLASEKFAEMKWRQDAVQTIFSGRLDIFYAPNSAWLRPNWSFSTAAPDFVNLAGRLQSQAERISFDWGEGVSAALDEQITILLPKGTLLVLF
jgi:hypothetical protein